MKIVVLFVLCLSVNATAQTVHQTEVDFSDAARRAQAVGNAERDLFSAFGPDKALVVNAFRNFCDKAVYEAGLKDKGPKPSIDFLGDLDTRICVDNLMIALSKYTHKR